MSPEDAKGAEPSRKVDILPGVSVLSVLRHLNYEPWFALAEFVDNSLQSAMARKADLRRVDGPDYRLMVDIEYDASDGGRVSVRDNAAGILDKDYDRAFKTAESPPDVGNLAEFGMGMKSAACWFANKWSVRSKALGEGEERLISFDVDAIVQRRLGQLPVQIIPASPDLHHTEIVLTALHKQLGGKTIGKIKDHIASTYRIFMREGFITLTYNNDELEYREPQILKAAFYKEPDGRKRMWRKDVDIDLGARRRIRGFVALRETASVSQAGFSVFRRDRLIQGGADTGYRPEQIFKKPNSYTYQRLFGELHAEGFGVTHTKDAIQWQGQEEAMLENLALEINKKPLPLLDQAEGYRVRPPKADLRRNTQGALNSMASIQSAIGADIERLAGPAKEPKPVVTLPPSPQPFSREMVLDFAGGPWKVTLEATSDPTVGDWLSVSDQPPQKGIEARQVTIRIALAHPFMVRFAGTGPDQLEPILRLGVGVGLAEIVARDGGTRMAGTIRRNLNELLRSSLSKPG